jgi:metal-dependent amidase/aminoacylase/carboxypeptidase family protein
VCSIHAGSAANVMPAEATFEGTVRAASDEVYERLFARIADVSVGMGEAFRCAVESRRQDTMPPVRNDPTVAALARAGAEAVVGTERAVEIDPVMAGDDVAHFFDRIRGCYVFVGSAPTDGRPATPNHSPSWDFDERALEIGARVLLGTIERLVEAA